MSKKKSGPKPRSKPDFGPAVELRLKRGEKMVVLPGDIAGTEHAVWLDTTLVDGLFHRGQLGQGESALRRRDAAESLRALFQRAGMEPRSAPMDGVPIQQAGVPREIGSSQAKAYSTFCRLMARMGAHRGKIRSMVCFDDIGDIRTKSEACTLLDHLAKTLKM